MRLGEWEGKALDELDRLEHFRRFNAYRSGVRAPGGELMLETQVRMVNRLEALAQRHPDETIAVVSHGDPLRALVIHHLGMSLDYILRLEISPASVSVLEAGAWGSRVVCLNHTGDVPL